MKVRRSIVLIITVALSGLLLWMTGRAQAHLPADEPVVRSRAKIASAVSPLLQYQGRLSDPSTGEPVADDTYSMVFSLYDVASGGSPLWTETKDVAVQGGLFSTALGDTTALDAGLFDGQALWLGITVGADAEATPRQQVLPVAYALSLVPGAVISTTSSSPALQVNNAGDGPALYIEGETAIDGGLSLNDSDDDPILKVVQSGAGAGGYFTSTATHGVQGRTAATSAGQAGVLGVAGMTTYFPSQESGVLGRASDGMGVSGMSDTLFGVYGYSTDSFAGYFYSNSGTSLYAAGGVTVTGDLEVNGRVTGGDQTALPIAYGVVNEDGTLASGSPNVSSAWNTSEYEITISGYNYYWSDYITTVTLFSGCNHAYSVRTSSVGGDLLVYVFDETGTETQCAFQFVSYKP